MTELNEDHSNPYEASAVPDQSIAPLSRSQPGPVAIVFSVFIGLTVAVVTFAVTFFFTCLGLTPTRAIDNEFGFIILILIAGITAIAAFVFTTWGILKIVRALKS